MAGQDTKPTILLISLSLRDCLEDLFHPLIQHLNEHAHVQRVKKAGSALRMLERQPAAALITDEALTLEENAHVWEAVLEYVRGGGTAILMGSFSSFTSFPTFKTFFTAARLPWEGGEYHRTTFVLNRSAVGPDLAAKLPAQYSQKAVILKNVLLSDSWYVTDENSVVESRVFAATNAHKSSQSPVTLDRIGDGKLGYIGDVNFEKGSDTVILAIGGLSSG